MVHERQQLQPIVLEPVPGPVPELGLAVPGLALVRVPGPEPALVPGPVRGLAPELGLVPEPALVPGPGPGPGPGQPPQHVVERCTSTVEELRHFAVDFEESTSE